MRTDGQRIETCTVNVTVCQQRQHRQLDIPFLLFHSVCLV